MVRRLTPLQVMQTGKLFDKYLSKEGCPEGKCRYTNGHSDQSIATELGLHSSVVVANLRRKTWGDFYFPESRRAASVSHANLRATTRKLALLVAELSAKLGEDEYAQLARRIANETTLPTED